MSEINETENKSKVNFYRLDKTKRYSAEGGASRSNVNFMIIFGAVFIVVALIVAVVMWKSIAESLVLIAVPLFLCLFGGAFLGVGVSSQLKNNGRRAEEQSVLNDCVLTDGRITECDCVTHRHSDSHGHSRTSYEYTLTYSFVDENLNERTGTYNRIYSTDPQFYKGQYLMIAFNEYDSLIMREFTLEGEDMQTFLANEASRSEDDFNSLTGEELDVDTSKPLKSFDGSFVFLVAGLGLLVFLCIYAAIFGAVMLPSIIGTRFDGIGSIFTVIAFLVIPVILIVLSAVTLAKYAKSVRPFKTVMKNNPRFTYGKMFASEMTYRGKSKKVSYCYIDKWGEKHTEQTEAPLFQREAQGEEKQIVVAYDAKGNSVVLTKYSFREK